MPIDLSPYGINWSVGPVLIPETNIIASVSFSPSTKKISITLPSAKPRIYTFDQILGKGSYGTVYTIKEKIAGVPVVLKVMQKYYESDHNDIAITYDDFLKETINQIIVCETTKHINLPELNLYGPFAPKIFLVGQDEEAYYIISERMTYTLEDYLISKKPDFKKIKSVFVQIAKMQEILHKELLFNHRDFKTDNIMCKIGWNGLPQVKYIDFGFSCLTYEGLKITTSSDLMKKCFSNSRDLGSLLFAFTLLKRGVQRPFTNYPEFYRIISVLLGTDLSEQPNNWSSTYYVLNRRNDVPNLHPLVVYNVFNSLELENSTFKPIWVKNLEEINYEGLTLLDEKERSLITKKQIETLPLNELSKMLIYITDYENYSEKLYALILSINPEIYNALIDGTCPVIEALKVNNREALQKLLDYPEINLKVKDAKNSNVLVLLLSERNYRQNQYDYIVSKEPHLVHEYNDANISPLEMAISRSNVIVVKSLLNNPNIDLLTTKSLNPLHYLLRMESIDRPFSNDIEIFNLIVEKEPELINRVDKSTKTVLMNACYDGCIWLIEKLLSYPHIKTSTRDHNGLTALHYLSMKSRNSQTEEFIKPIEMLLKKNPALANIKNVKGRGPANPNYAGTGLTRKYIKASKSGIFTKKHINTNLNRRQNVRKNRPSSNSSTTVY